VSGENAPGARGAAQLTLVRHGESVGNVAATAAERAGLEIIDLATRDADTPLSSRGAEQAHAFGTWLRDCAQGTGPQIVWCSPYVRAVQTATIALEAARSDLTLRLDERLRDRELGILDLLTTTGVDARYPAEAARRRHLGKFYYRPPGGESWADLALRIRTFLSDLDGLEDGRRVLIVAHDAVIMTIRYVCEALTEQGVLDLARHAPVRNATVTRLVRNAVDGTWALAAFNEDDHLEREGAPKTTHPGDRDALPD
jgi:probable phosphoglycerate mutase